MNKEIINALCKIDDIELRTTISGYIIAQEYKLKNAIIPKFKIGQDVYMLDRYYDDELDKYVNDCLCYKVKNIHYHYKCDGTNFKYDLTYGRGNLDEDNLYATQEEVMKKIQELENE